MVFGISGRAAGRFVILAVPMNRDGAEQFVASLRAVPLVCRACGDIHLSNTEAALRWFLVRGAVVPVGRTGVFVHTSYRERGWEIMALRLMRQPPAAALMRRWRRHLNETRCGASLNDGGWSRKIGVRS